ncbi:MAG TPA: FMN-binding protein [Acidimicrobiales bacterium]|jgi:uncharacterized protein with FMN-binding domain|nr:FMN-binding protein [Acidimicrobiales bacterium]
MQRYQLVLGGTVAGIAGVLAFPTHSTKLVIPSARASATTSTSPTTSAAPASKSSAASSSSTKSTTTTAPASTTRSATSADEQFRYGDVEVKVTVTGSKITGVTIAALNETDGRSAEIDNYAVPQLEQQVISAGSVNINGVSGATFTSQAFVDAVANALQKLGIS